jgi:hypothetical protein
MSEFHFTGSVDIELPASGPTINTPGSKNAHIISASNMPWEFPVYNEALGVFALLERPKIEISQVIDYPADAIWTIDTVTIYLGLNGFTQRLVGYPAFTRDHITQFKLHSPLKYYINPALDIKSVEISVVFEIEGSVENPKTPAELTPVIAYNQVYPHHVTVNSSNIPESNVNIESVYFDANTSDTTFRSMAHTENYQHNGTIQFHTIPLPLEAMNSATYSFAMKDSIKYPDVFRYRYLESTPVGTYLQYQDHFDGLPLWIPSGVHKPFLEEPLFGANTDVNHLINSSIGCAYGSPTNGFTISTINANYFNNSDFPTFKFMNVKMKLLVEIEYNDLKLDGTPQHHSYLFSYNIDLEDVHNPDDETSNGSVVWSAQNYLNPYLVGSLGDYTQFDEVSIFDLTHFDGTLKDNCVLIGNQYLCKGRSDIEIVGDITVEPDYSVRFIAPNSITVYPESDISPEVELILESIYQNLTPANPQTYSEVQDFCTKDYEARQLQRSLAIFYDSLAQTNPSLESLPDPIEFIIFPNPTTGASQAGIYLPELATVSITIVDLSGKVVGRPVQNVTLANGRNVQNLDTESLGPGIYLVHLVVNGEKFVQRLVKQ